MPRYIDIDGYRKLFDREYKETKKLIEQGETHLNNLAEGFHEASQVIDRIPTADVQEVRRGHWNTDRFGMERAVCSLCGTTYEGADNWNYCPHCGARMDESATDIFVGTY